MPQPPTAPPVDPQGTTPFAERVAAKIEAAQASVPSMVVLVWGPGETVGDPWWEKRLDIRNALREAGHEAYFSEELPGGLPTQGDARQIALRNAEFIQANEADYIIVLMSSVGAVSEFHDFGDKPHLAKKMLVFMDETHQAGYSASLLGQFEAAHGKVELVKVPDDLVECNVLGRSLERIQGIRDLKLHEALEGGTYE